MAAALTDGELTVLGLLVEQPRHGYELERVIEERGVRAWTALGFSSIYYVLDRLAARGLIESTGTPATPKARVTFRATADGRELCAAATREALEALMPVRSRVLIAMANSQGLPATDVVEGLTVRVQALRARLEEVRTTRIEQQPLPTAAEAIFEYSEAMLTAEIGWAEGTLRTLTEETAMEKYDVKKAYKHLYSARTSEFTVVDVPELRYVAVDGEGDPNTAAAYGQAVEALFGVAYTLKFASKRTLGRDFVVGPLEGLWRADDPSTFVTRRKDAWKWTMMISRPDWIDDAMVAAAVEDVGRKKDLPALGMVRPLTVTEGRCVQILHVGPYDDEGPTLQRLHHAYLPGNGLTFNGDHHEIYLSDARRTAADKLRTILRQPVSGGTRSSV